MKTALKRVGIPSPNYSSRGGSSVRLIVLHTAEGARTYQDLGAFFQNPASGVSSHVGIDDTPNTVGEYVQRSGKAWTAAAANPYSVQAELCAFAEWTSEWDNHLNMLANTAQWIAEEARYFGIPLVRLSASQAQSGQAGVCQHVDLGSAGGGHWDCGPGFPMDKVMAMAGGKAPPEAVPAPPPPTGGDDMFVIEKNGDVLWFIPDGPDSYWRPVPTGQVQDIPDHMLVRDPNGSWKAMWRVGEPR